MASDAVTVPELSPDRVRAALRRATRALVEEGGLSAVTVRAVAARTWGSEASSARLYAYYASCDALLTEAANEALREAITGGLDALPDETARLVLGHADAWPEYVAGRGDVDAVRRELGERLLGLRGV